MTFIQVSKVYTALHSGVYALPDTFDMTLLSNVSECDYTLRKKKYFRAPFLVLQVVTNRGLYSVPGRTK